MMGGVSEARCRNIRPLRGFATHREANTPSEARAELPGPISNGRSEDSRSKISTLKDADRKDAMKKTGELDIRGTLVRVVKINGEDYVSLTDMAKLKSEDAQQTISNWMRNRMTLEYLGLWEELYNPDFKPLGFEGFRKEVGLNHFTMSPSKWIDGVNAIGIVAYMENINAVMINDGIPQPQRLKKLNEIAIQQMRILSEVDGRKYLK